MYKCSTFGDDTNDYFIPYGFYGDDAGVHKKEKLLILQFHGVLPAESAFQKLLVTVMPYARILVLFLRIRRHFYSRESFQKFK